MGWARTDLQGDLLCPCYFDLTCYTKASVFPTKPNFFLISVKTTLLLLLSSLWDPVSVHMACKMGLKERRNGIGGVHSGQGGCLWEKNKGIFSSLAHKCRGSSTHNKSEGLARPDISSLLPWILCTLSHTSEDAHTYSRHQRNTQWALCSRNPEIIATEIKMKSGHWQKGGQEN